MTDQTAYVTLNGRPVTWLRLTVSYRGPWHAEVHLSDDDAIPNSPGALTLAVGPTMRLTGTVMIDHDGTQTLTRRSRIVGGGGGWSRPLTRKSYHNDAGVKARLVVDDVAREVTETIGTFTPQRERLGVDYARRVDRASVTLHDAIGQAAWYVDYEGVTHVGPRPLTELDPVSYHVLAYDASNRIATLTADDPGLIQIGATLSTGLDVPGVVREFELTAGGDSELRIVAWLGGVSDEASRLAGLMRSIIKRVTEGPLLGHYRYRVISKSGDRYNLQAVNVAAGLPDLAPITPWPGVAGTAASLAPGGEVLVAFVEGDRAQPVITHYTPIGTTGFAPIALTLGGDGPAQPAARQNDSVEVLLPPAIFTGTINGAPATGSLVFPAMKAVGVITGGSSKVKVTS